MENKGIYVLWLYLDQKTKIQVGRLGSYTFEQGLYAYIGSAQRNLKQRVARHQRLDKKLHWHIDYFRAHAELLAVTYFINQPQAAECEITGELTKTLDATVPVSGFGSSDCSCKSHFLYFSGGDQKSISIFLRDAVHSVDLSAAELLTLFNAGN